MPTFEELQSKRKNLVQLYSMHYLQGQSLAQMGAAIAAEPNLAAMQVIRDEIEKIDEELKKMTIPQR